ncbi:unnamed protein product [Bursaphelenchus xylophilus]|uniref:(pine wood nematode) hypothetical protein n=1 Tax=Bursaphelenchus xylophilus TaxID=6326 RepID=A0A1I7RUI9_BURXY|nr:unnamed protein product [Bursaphelenchus xylophilus]CAG9114158.1 unnamed protein product [Bursaphelenchus xylophilus]
MEDDAFNALAYDEDFMIEEDPGAFDEEAEMYLAEQRAHEPQNPQQNPPNADDLFADDLDLSVDPFAAPPAPPSDAELREKRRKEQENLPLGEHPLDWFIRSDLDPAAAKKKKREDLDLKTTKLADRIAQERRRRSLKTFGQNNDENQVYKPKYLKEIPDGEDKKYIKISDPDGLEEGFLKLESLSLDDWMTEKVRKMISKSIQDIGRSRPQVQAQPPPATTQDNTQNTQIRSNLTANTTLNSTTNPDSTVNRTHFIDGVDLSQFGLNESELLNADDTDFDIDLSQSTMNLLAQTTIDIPQSSTANPSVETSLWTTKYEPKSYFDLLSEDSQNKTVLAWLKLWDRYVFNKKVKIDGLLDEYHMKMLEVEEERPNLPKMKMLLLHGPSGCGKSTLAKVCAATAGYEPFFVNLGEITSLAHLKSLIYERSGNISMDHYTRTDRPKVAKPICFIIEGLDGASGDFVKFLTTYVTEKKKKLVRRPMIVSCNNAFSNAIKTLRSAALVVKCSGLNKERAVKRLIKICEDEGLTMKRFTIVQLFEQCRGDLRLTLNNLQFLTSTSRDGSAVSAECSSRIEEFSIFDAMDAILTTNYHLDARGHIKSPKQRAETIHQVLSRRDDLDRVYTAVFYNAPSVFKLKMFQRLKICRSLIFVNEINRFVQRSQNFSLMRYSVAAAMQIHFAVATPSTTKHTYSLSFMAFSDKQKENREILSSLEQNQRPDNRRTRNTLLLHILPYVCSIINIPLKSQNSNMLSNADKEAVGRVADIMVALGIGFAQKLDQGLLNLALDPPVDQLVCFHYTSKQAKMTSTLMKILNNEVRQRRIRASADEHVTIVNKEVAEPNKEAPKTLYAIMGGKDQKRRSTENQGSIFDSITDSGFTYAQGSSQAIRRIIRNKNFINLENF